MHNKSELTKTQIQIAHYLKYASTSVTPLSTQPVFRTWNLRFRGRSYQCLGSQKVNSLHLLCGNVVPIRTTMYNLNIARMVDYWNTTFRRRESTTWFANVHCLLTIKKELQRMAIIVAATASKFGLYNSTSKTFSFFQPGADVPHTTWITIGANDIESGTEILLFRCADFCYTQTPD